MNYVSPENNEKWYIAFNTIAYTSTLFLHILLARVVFSVLRARCVIHGLQGVRTRSVNKVITLYLLIVFNNEN